MNLLVRIDPVNERTRDLLRVSVRFGMTRQQTGQDAIRNRVNAFTVIDGVQVEAPLQIEDLARDNTSVGRDRGQNPGPVLEQTVLGTILLLVLNENLASPALEGQQVHECLITVQEICRSAHRILLVDNNSSANTSYDSNHDHHGNQRDTMIPFHAHLLPTPGIITVKLP